MEQVCRCFAAYPCMLPKNVINIFLRLTSQLSAYEKSALWLNKCTNATMQCNTSQISPARKTCITHILLINTLPDLIIYRQITLGCSGAQICWNLGLNANTMQYVVKSILRHNILVHFIRDYSFHLARTKSFFRAQYQIHSGRGAVGKAYPYFSRFLHFLCRRGNSAILSKGCSHLSPFTQYYISAHFFNIVIVIFGRLKYYCQY